jgi:hypothetical protein
LKGYSILGKNRHICHLSVTQPVSVMNTKAGCIPARTTGESCFLRLTILAEHKLHRVSNRFRLPWKRYPFCRPVT